MRFGKIALLSAFVYASVANAQDVMVDLSVLDDLDAPYTNELKPLFPVLSKKTDTAPKKTIKKKSRLSRKSLKKNRAKKLIETVKPLDADAVVVDVEPVEPAKIPAKVETTTPQPTVQKQAEVVEQPKPVAPVVKDQPKVVVEEVQPKVEPQGAIEAAPVIAEKGAEEANVDTDIKVVEPKEELLVKEEPKVVETSNYIKFADDVDELNDAQMLQIDTIVSTYENTPKNKIAIYSYNLDNGVDSFKRKRTSLNRAVNVRSYLLKKGYKNFSIKVININSVSDKQNMVELQEI